MVLKFSYLRRHSTCIAKQRNTIKKPFCISDSTNGKDIKNATRLVNLSSCTTHLPSEILQTVACFNVSEVVFYPDFVLESFRY